MEQYIISKEKADWIGQEIGKLISKELQLGHKLISLHIRNDDAGMDYVTMDIDSSSGLIMIDAQEEWRDREYQDTCLDS